MLLLGTLGYLYNYEVSLASLTSNAEIQTFIIDKINALHILISLKSVKKISLGTH